jgi:hypothetical protein
VTALDRHRTSEHQAKFPETRGLTVLGVPRRYEGSVSRLVAGKYAALREQPFRSIAQPSLLRCSGRFGARGSFVILDLLLLRALISQRSSAVSSG